MSSLLKTENDSVAAYGPDAQQNCSAVQYYKCRPGGSAGLRAPYRKVWLSTVFHAEWFDVKS